MKKRGAPKKETKKGISIRLPDKMYDALKKEADDNLTTVSSLVIKHFLKGYRGSSC